MPSPTNQCAPGESNCGLGPLRYSVPFNSRGSSPVIFRKGASDSKGIGARLGGTDLLAVSCCMAAFLLDLYNVKIALGLAKRLVKQNLYSVKIASYNGFMRKPEKIAARSTRRSRPRNAAPSRAGRKPRAA